MARLCPLFSGSTGNSYYIGSRSAGLLIDAGRSARQLENMLKLCGIDPLAIGAILVTHEHSDHVAGLRVFAKRFHLPVYASEGTLNAMYTSLEGIDTGVVYDGMRIAGMTVHPFETSHDCADPNCYRIETADGRVFAIATDLGYISDEVKANLMGADMVVIESNHDLDMLRHGPYPMYLKRRIASYQGHLSNDDCAGVIPELYKSGTKRFLLAHLSCENNTPSLAVETALKPLIREGLRRGEDFLLEAAAPENLEGKTIIF